MVVVVGVDCIWLPFVLSLVNTLIVIHHLLFPLLRILLSSLILRSQANQRGKHFSAFDPE